jgi:hypothetical protein
VNADLQPVVAALADLSDSELEALIATVNDCPQFAPRFLAWVEHVCDWEQNRRRGRGVPSATTRCNHPMQPSDAAIDPSEDAVSIGAAMAMRDSLRRMTGPRR